MTRLPLPARTGMPLADVDTPALLLDLDAFERNLDRLERLTLRFVAQAYFAVPEDGEEPPS